MRERATTELHSLHHRYQQVIVIILALGVMFLLVDRAALTESVSAQESGISRKELDRPSPITLNPEAGTEVAFVYEAFLSPQQEGGEEEDTPSFMPPEFRSSAPSVSRNERPDRGHAVIEFTKDLSRAYVHLAVINVKPEDVVMLHLHCGRPGQLGPILIDFALAGSINEYLADGKLTLEVTNEDIEATTDHGHGLTAAFTVGCPIVPTIPNDRVKTIAGMEVIAREGELYFNLHTKAQTYFGDIRGQFHLVDMNSK